LDSKANAMRKTPFNVHSIKLRTSAIVTSSDVEQHSFVQQGWISDECVMKRDLLWKFTVRLYAPDVHFIRREASNKVDELSVRRPSQIVAMNSPFSRVNLLSNPFVACADKDRIAWRIRVVRNPSPLRRPDKLNPI